MVPQATTSLELLVMQVRAIDVHDDAEVGAWWEVSKAADAFGRAEFATHWSLRAATVAFRAEKDPVRRVPLVAYDGTIPSGALPHSGDVVVKPNPLATERG